jgi:hypothetical protein
MSAVWDEMHSVSRPARADSIYHAEAAARTSARSWRSSSLASAERPLAAGRKRSQRSTPHLVFPAGGCMTCAGRLRQGCSASRAP